VETLDTFTDRLGVEMGLITTIVIVKLWLKQLIE
jgi:hypothetical protein